MCIPFSVQANDPLYLQIGSAAAWILIGLIVGLLLGQRLPRGRQGRRASGRSGTASSGGVEIYAGNLAYDLSEDELGGMFERYGTVESARLITNRFNGKSKGYGFINMRDPDAAREAIQALNGKNIKGREIIVNEAKSKSKRNGR